MFCFLLSQYFHIAIDYFHKVHIGNKNRQCFIFSNLKRLQVKRHLQFMTEDNLAVKKTSIWRLAEKKKGSWIQSRLKLSIKKNQCFQISSFRTSGCCYFLLSFLLCLKFQVSHAEIYCPGKGKMKTKKIGNCFDNKMEYIYICVCVCKVLLVYDNINKLSVNWRKTIILS